MPFGSDVSASSVSKRLVCLQNCSSKRTEPKLQSGEILCAPVVSGWNRHDGRCREVREKARCREVAAVVSERGR